MATAAQAIERIAEAAGILPATVFRAARTLREADASLWPQGSAGRGKAALVSPAHLVNLILPLAYDQPMTSAVGVAAMLRSMTPWLIRDWKWQSNPAADGDIPPGDLAGFVFEWNQGLIAEGKLPPEMAYAILPGITLGEALERLIEKLADPSGLFLKKHIFHNDMQIDINSAGVPTVSVGYNSFGDDKEYYLRGNYMLPQESLKLGVAVGITGITTKKRIHGSVILCLADLWADTLTQRAGGAGTSGSNLALPISSKEEPTKPSKTETAAPQLPGRGTAEFSDQSAETELEGCEQPYSSGEREKSQSPSPRAGRSPKHLWSDPYARSGDGGAYCATA